MVRRISFDITHQAKCYWPIRFWPNRRPLFIPLQRTSRAFQTSAGSHQNDECIWLATSSCVSESSNIVRYSGNPHSNKAARNMFTQLMSGQIILANDFAQFSNKCKPKKNKRQAMRNQKPRAKVRNQWRGFSDYTFRTHSFCRQNLYALRRFLLCAETVLGYRITGLLLGIYIVSPCCDRRWGVRETWIICIMTDSDLRHWLYSRFEWIRSPSFFTICWIVSGTLTLTPKSLSFCVFFILLESWSGTQRYILQ